MPTLKRFIKRTQSSQSSHKRFQTEYETTASYSILYRVIIPCPETRPIAAAAIIIFKYVGWLYYHIIVVVYALIILLYIWTVAYTQTVRTTKGEIHNNIRFPTTTRHSQVTARVTRYKV